MNKRMTMMGLVLVVLSLLPSCGKATKEAAPSQKTETPKYVFLFIGDGMGPVQRQVADHAAREQTGDPLRMETFPVRGRIHTRSANKGITDSAAAATALACGVKTNNGMLGMTPDETVVPPLCAKLSQAGMKIGLLSSVPLNHATPAAFYSHVPKRGMYDEIASQVFKSDVDFLLGNKLLSQSEKQQEIMEAWTKEGLTVATTLPQAAAAKGEARVVAVLDFPDAILEQKDVSAGPGALAAAVSVAIQRLENANGFFMMVEGGKIDWVCHANNAGQSIAETLAMDRAIQVAYAFYRKRPDQTLILVTADHETGGMGLDRSRLDLKRLAELAEKVDELDKALGDEKAITPSSVDHAIANVLGLKELSQEERGKLVEVVQVAKPSKRKVLKCAMSIAQQRAGITWSTGGHTDVDVPVTAIGAGARAFEGTYDNTKIPAKLLRLCLPAPPGVE